MKRSRGWRALLWPLSGIYFLASRLRVRLYERGIFKTRRLPGMVISVGNLTVGGTGKTPMVLWLADSLTEEGKKTAILTRGYGGTGVDAHGLPQSDEVALLRERLPGKVQIGVGADRYASGEIVARHGVEWFVLDDGFQHLKLFRDIDIVMIDATDPFGGGLLLPAGRLREPVSALRRADAVVITRSTHVPLTALETMIRRYTMSPIFYAKTKFHSLRCVPQFAVQAPREDWCEFRFMMFCAIGNPAAFAEDLREWGFNVVGQHSFPDHHVYTKAEIADLECAAKNCGANALLCTEKDVWNLRDVHFTVMPAYCCRICLQLPPEFGDFLRETVERGEAGAVP